MVNKGQKLKEKIVAQALEYCSHHRMQDVKLEDFKKILEILTNYYNEKQS